MVFGDKKLQEFENNLQNLSSDNDLEDKKVINPDEKQELEIDKEVEKTEKTEKKTRRFLKKEAKLKDLENQIQNLTTRNITLEIEAIKLKDKIKKLEEDFKSQVKTFEEKATQRVKELKLDLQKKLENEQDLLKKYSLQPFFEDFSSPFLNLKKAISYGLISQNPEISAYVKGFEMLVNQIENVMENFGLVKIYPKIGDFFDSSVHEIYEIKTGENDKILEVVSEGYKLHDRIVKTALVVVGKPNEEKN
ncbi:nucleotide exchange factor GrpE [Mesomycoplasma hyopneumoniae]|uniref:Protein GrpE n=2 Tax=Mesomycoplasma hyopneumoniae TaxID=2099 RepID=Q4A901_MESH7|nr:nucleotide exchange factor GrpE [Mesomycoplasma hyopneumoniae]AAZ53388.2 heat shock protein [Mesomycoplasma hyopneumoniae 7448]AGQ50621.1 heat shock protein [Mesomycoplasma hyopneumoniae 7422]ASU14090.1 Protein GrpE [Mesomycoplasma hyopneumoniae]MXR33853.1 nucleotide exchange factor GrpE [Mesomycoplasma hyopneumoniae]MXR34109.1 nucleotide exchange factor GrpE [Mesomycoplasma hyopneumoniae]